MTDQEKAKQVLESHFSWVDCDCPMCAGTRELLSGIAAGTHWIAPMEPTEEMIERGHHQIDWCRDKQDTSTPHHVSQMALLGGRGVGTDCGQDILDAYRAMRDAYLKGGKDE